MRFKNPVVQKFWRFSTSFYLGVPIMVAIAVLVAWGTIVESRYDAWTASYVVYRSWMMTLVMALLIYNLAMVMIDRLPWKTHHYPFLLVHAGIITIILGGWVTQKFGLDGSMPLPFGGQSNLVTVSETDFVAYATFDGDSYRKIFDQPVDFFKNEPTEKNPLRVQLSDGELLITKFVPYARVTQKVRGEENDKLGASVKFQISNANMNQSEQITQDSKNKATEVTMGLMTVNLGHDYQKSGRKKKETNEIYFVVDGPAQFKYAFFDKNTDKPYKQGVAKVGDVLETHWMGFQLRILDYLQFARQQWDVKPVGRPTPLTTSAVLMKYNQREEWILLNDVLKIFGDNTAFLVSYQNRRIQLDFPIKLEKFEIQHYEGTRKAKSYASLVRAGEGPRQEEHLISMNEPMKYSGYTFYQSSFQQDERTGEPNASIFSVNKDPGRWIKYLGSLIMSVGIVWLFYQKRKRRTAL